MVWQQASSLGFQDLSFFLARFFHFWLTKKKVSTEGGSADDDSDLEFVEADTGDFYEAEGPAELGGLRMVVAEPGVEPAGLE